MFVGVHLCGTADYGQGGLLFTLRSRSVCRRPVASSVTCTVDVVEPKLALHSIRKTESLRSDDTRRTPDVKLTFSAKPQNVVPLAFR